MEKGRLTNADITGELDLPESTARYYQNRFDAFLPMIGEGCQLRYLPEALEVFRVMAETPRNSGTADEAQEALSRLFPRNIDIPHAQQQQIAVPQQQQSFGVVEAFQSLRPAVETQSQRVSNLGEEVRQLREQLAERDDAHERRLDEWDQAIVATMRRLMETRQQSFWHRLFGPRPPMEDYF